jgi:adenylate cyclase, class 2
VPEIESHHWHSSAEPVDQFGPFAPGKSRRAKRAETDFGQAGYPSRVRTTDRDGTIGDVTGIEETEVKLRVAEERAALERIRAAGFRISVPREFEANTLYDTADRALLREGMLLRLRQAGEREVITWKGRVIPGPHKSRPELETSLGSLGTMAEIFDRLGYRPTFRYEKFRTEFRAAAGEGVVVLDETPIGIYLELEGPGDWIDRTARELGFSRTDYVVESYGTLYRNYCAERGVQPGDMVFQSK